jgi:hypothetical protein
MKIIELINRVPVAINNEQADMLGRFNVEDIIFKNTLNEREVEVANQLTSQGLLLRRNENGKITYKKKT